MVLLVLSLQSPLILTMPHQDWTKQGNSSELSTSETLTLSKLTREDDGSVFECTAQNYITSVKAMAALTVLC